LASSRMAARLPRLSLLGKFALVSLIPIVLLGLVLAKTLQVQIRNQALTSARQLAALVARLDIRPQLKPDDLSQGLTQVRLQRLDQALHAGLVGEEIARVKIWSRDLRVVYSDDPELIGRAFPSSDELEEALDGHVASEVSDLTKEENVGDRSYGKLLEVYVPLTFPGEPTPAGAFELYLPYRPIEAAVTRDTHRLYLVLLGGLAVLYVALFRIVATASRRLRRQADRELRLANEERDLALRKAAVIATVSHEFRTPLTIIEGVSSTLERHDLVAGAGRSLLDSLRSASHRLHDLVDALLTAAEGTERQEVQRRPVVLSEVIRAVVDGLASFDAHSRVRVVAIADGDTVMSDPAMLEPLLRHIIENALKFSPPGSAVDISIARASREVEVRVRDRGPGIGPEFMERAFDPFTQEDQSSTRAKPGLGIGLFAARKIAELIGGRVELQRHPGGGMEAILHLPDTVEDRALVTADVEAADSAAVGLVTADQESQT
jgi:signal transduction histidine kinase